MSANGSDFENDGDFIQEPSAKKSRLEEGHGEVLQLHTGWDSREASVRHAAYTTEGEGPVPVPQSDFEIEINSSNQDGGPTSPGHEITLTSASITLPMEPRILTIDARLHESSSLVSSDHSSTVPGVGPMCPPDQQTIGVPSSPDDVPSDHSPSNIAAHHDFTSLIAAAGRSGLIPSSDHLPTTSDLANSQFILQSQPRSTGTDGSQPGGPLYVMIPPTSTSADLLQAAMQSPTSQPNQQRPIVPRLASGAILEPTEDNRKQKEYMRKQTHNEVERRRRDRINELIKMLAEIVPGCQKKDASNGAIVGYVYSKGTVLEKTVEYVRELLTQNEQLSSTAKLAEKSANALQVLQNQITVLEKENAFLRAQMIQLGIDSSTSSINTRSLLTNSLTQSLLNTSQVATPPLVPNTTQLLMNLAQSLTSNPLLASLSQQANSPSTNDTPSQHPTMLTPTAGTTPPSNAATPPSGGGPHHVSNLVALNSLAQTLASITGSSTSSPVPPPPPPPPTQSSASVAMNILNSLIMAQSALNANTTTTPSAPPTTADTPTPTGVNLLISSPEKAPT